MDQRAEAPRDLLYGLLALQAGLIDQGTLLTAFNTWSRANDRSMAEILTNQGALDEPERSLLEGLIAVHLKRHGGALEKSLTALSSVGALRGDLGRIADPDLQATLSYINTNSRDEETDATKTFEAGTSPSTNSRFRILRPHAQGGLGEVFVAFDEELHREVALKQIQNRYADSAEKRDRFLLEAEITGRLEHPGIVPVYGLGFGADGHPFYAMRLIEGENLKQAALRFHREDWPSNNINMFTTMIRQLLGRFVAICNAIAYAHSRGVLHRDIKPSNIMLGPFGETLVVDWGLAGLVSLSDVVTEAPARPLRPSFGRLAGTQVGSTVGTPGFMSPEQTAGQLDRLGPTSDVYSLGATLYFILTGRAPFEEAEVGLILVKVRNGEFPAPRLVNPAISPVLEKICLNAMALHPVDRYASPLAMAEDIELWLASDESRLRHSEKLASIGLLSAGIAHEIAKPLSLVDNKLAILEQDLEGSRTLTRREHLELLTLARDSLRRVDEIVLNLRGQAQISSPKMESVLIANLVDSALEMIRGSLQRQSIEVEVEHTSGEPRLTCVPAHMNQVILNLLINAVQAIESARRTDGGLIRVTTSYVGDLVVLTVSDNGCGISPAHQAQLFDPFFTTKPPGEGTGLGLSICHGIVAGHGGHIEVETHLGKGSSFYVYLPLHCDERI